MPNTSERERLLRNLDRGIRRLSFCLARKPCRRQLAAFLSLRQKIINQRYLERSDARTRYLSHNLALDNGQRFPETLVGHKHLRCSRTGFDRLLDMIAGHAAFTTTGNRPQAPPRLQLAVFLNRMAHGEDVQSLATRFDVSGAPTTYYRSEV